VGRGSVPYRARELDHESIPRRGPATCRGDEAGARRSYKPPAAEVICLHAKRQKRYSAAWKDFSPKGAKAIAEAGINVSNPDDAGAKQGEVRVSFGDATSKPVIYSVEAVPLSMTPRGKGMDIAFDGKTRDGVGLRVKASCQDVEQM